MSDSVPVVVPSYRFNFLAERTIETMEERAYVVHVAKSAGMRKRWSCPCVIAEVDSDPARIFHHFVIEDVLLRNYLPEIPGDIVIFTDHDFAWNPGCFQSAKAALLEAMTPDVKLAWTQSAWMRKTTEEGTRIIPFHTCPMFAVKRCKESMMRGAWAPDREWPDGDTGWGLARYLIRTQPGSVVSVLFDMPKNGNHIGSSWILPAFEAHGKYMNDPSTVIPIQNEMTSSIINGKFKPHRYEVPQMCKSSLFHPYLRDHMHVPDLVEYDDSLYVNYRCDNYYQSMWNEISCLDESMPRLEKRIEFMMAGKKRYEHIAKLAGVPWYLVASIHAMESEDEPDPWACSLHNGLPWAQKNIHALGKPGPFSSFTEAALHALDKHGGKAKHEIIAVSRYLEVWNGISKFKKLKMHSPYLYAHSNKLGCYGKYKRTILNENGQYVISERVTYGDKISFKFVPDVFNNQVGSVVALKEMSQRGMIEIHIGIKP